MKKILATVAAFATASSAMAGTLVYTAPEVVEIEAPATMGGSGAWLIPLVVITILLISLQGDSEPNNGRG